MISMRKLARVAGVSTATVSRALHNDPRVRLETRQRIQALADQHHYLPNYLTQGLFTGQTHMIGLILPSFRSTAYADFLQGVLEEARSQGYHVNVAEGHQTIAQLRAILNQFVELRADGIICRPGVHAALPRDLLLKAYSYGTAVVGVDLYDTEFPMDQLRCDEAACAEVVLDYLISLGHRTLAFVGAIGKDGLRGRGLAFHTTMKRHRLATAHFIDVPSGLLEASRAQAILTDLLALPTRPTAIIGWDDLVACPLVQQAQSLGVAVPRQLSVIGIGNMTVAEVTSPALTSLELNFAEYGRAAVRLTIARHRATSEPPPPYQCVTTPPRLIIRGSCAPPRS